MFEPTPAGNDEEELQKTRIIAKIFTYLNAEELRNARLVNFALNKIITSHPELFWAKNVLRVKIRSFKNDKQLRKEWAQFRLNKLVSEYHCPNFHFVQTDLRSPWSIAFFQSSVRHQLKHLVLSKCHISSEILMHILACISRKLEHLKIQDFSKFDSSTTMSEESIIKPVQPFICFPHLRNLILSRESRNTARDKSLVLDLPRILLLTILNGSRRLRKICLLDWDAKTCQAFTKILASIDPEKIEHVHTLEITCAWDFDFDLDPKRQYALLKPLGWIYMPHLKKLKIGFKEACDDVMGGCSNENEQLEESATNSVATLIEGCAESLETLELINCPVGNGVFRGGINAFPNLRNVKTAGSFVTSLDFDGNDLLDQCATTPSENLKRSQSTISSGGESDMESTLVSENISRTTSTNFQQRHDEPRVFTRVEVYQIICVIFLFVAAVHYTTHWAFGSYIGGNLEVFIYALVVLGFMKSSEFSQMWNTLYPE